jgi:amino acid transporter
LIAATFFMVSGGTYGTEDIVRGAGYGTAILILLVTPLLWSLPTAYMLGELASALPCEGGFYAWVRRGMGNFWGFQEAWLSLVASVFDMAIYPTLFVLYLTNLFPWFGVGHRGLFVGLGVVVLCALLNIAGVRVVSITSLWLFFLLSSPFAMVIVLALFHAGAFSTVAVSTSGARIDFMAGFLVAMWNYMGWDNATTIATQVDNPQKTYPRALLGTVAIVAFSYIVPFAAMWLTRLPSDAWETGSWATVAGMLGGPVLRIVMVFGAMLSAFGMFNALVMSYSRLPLAMALDGLLPRAFSKLDARTNAPSVSILFLATGWALCLGLGFERLITLDILIYGLSLLLEFATLVALRVREPGLPRPFRVPGGLFGAIAVGIPPAALLAFSVVRSESEHVLGMSSFALGAILIAAGIVVYAITALVKPAGWQRSVEQEPIA